MKIPTWVIGVLILVALGYGWYAFAGGKQALSSVTDSRATYEEQATQNSQATVYTNAALGISYTLPSDWWLYGVNSTNFAVDPGKTTDFSLQEVISNEGHDFVELMSLGNYQYSNEIDHIGIDLNAERLAGFSDIDDFMDYYDDFMLEPTEEFTYALEEAEAVILSGRAWVRRVYRVTSVELASDYYYVLALITPLKEDFFLVTTASYWPEMTNAANIITNHFETNLRFI